MRALLHRRTPKCPNADWLTHTLAADVFLERCAAFGAWLAARPEDCIAVVSHWGVIDALTSLEFQNCELRTFPLSRLAVRAPRELGPLVPPG